MSLNEEIHQLRTELAKYQAEVEALGKKVETIVNLIGQQSTIIRGFEDERQRDIGAKGTLKFLWVALTTGMASLAYNLHDILVFFFPPRH